MTDITPQPHGLSTTVNDDRIQNLADAFSRIMRDWLKPTEMAEVLHRNRTNPPNICATHDFRDANMAMAEAFTHVIGRAVNLASEADAAVWNAAWARAKNAQFRRKVELIENAEGKRVGAFLIREMWIDDPRRSTSKRFDVDPAEYYGLRQEELSALDMVNSQLCEADNASTRADSITDPAGKLQAPSMSVPDLRNLYVNLTVWQTGGGSALRHDCDDGGYLLVTDDGGLQIPADDAASAYVGRYAANGYTLEEPRTIPIEEVGAWIEAALSRANNPRNIADYFAKQLGAAHGDDSLRQLPVDSACGEDCAEVIDATADVLEHLRAAFDRYHPVDVAEEQLIEIARIIVGVYWRG